VVPVVTGQDRDRRVLVAFIVAVQHLPARQRAVLIFQADLD
jgi:hypothetical protein